MFGLMVMMAGKTRNVSNKLTICIFFAVKCFEIAAIYQVHSHVHSETLKDSQTLQLVLCDF